MKWARNVVRTCMDIKAGERVQVWVDEPLIGQGLVLVREIKNVGGETLFIVFPDSIRPIEKFPETLSATSRETDVLIWWFNKLTTSEHPAILSTIARFTGDGARMAGAIFIDDDVLENEMSADYSEISKRTEKLANFIKGGKDVHLTAPGGTDIKFSIEGRECFVDSGFIHKKGIFRNLPAGEVFVAPVEESANGVVVFDKSIVLDEIKRGLLKTPITLSFRNGKVLKIEGGEEAAKLRKTVEEAGKGADVIAELGIGTNHCARLMGNPMTDEKVLGTAHIAIGDNVHIPIGGKNEAKTHIDGIIGEPTIVVDGKTIMTKGKFVFS